MLLFAGLREVMTPDMERYKELYHIVIAGNSAEIEPSFIFLSKILNAFGLDYHALFFAYTLITLVFLYLAISNCTRHIRLALLFYILIPACFLNLFVEMREVAAISIAFYATSILRQDDRKFRFYRVLFFALLSVLFHLSAIAYWAFFCASYGFIKRRRSIAIHCTALVLSLVVPTSAVIGLVRVIAYPFLPAKYQSLINVFLVSGTTLAEPGQIIKSLVYTLMAVCFIIWDSPLPEDDQEHLSVNLFVAGVVLMNLTRGFGDISRLSYYFLIFQVIIWASPLARIKDRIFRMTAVYGVVLFYLTQFLWGLFYFSVEAHDYVFLHYRNVLFSSLQ